MRAQANMPSLDDAAEDYGDFSLDDGRLVVVHLLLYGHDMQAPSVADAREWAEHYGIDKRPNHVVLVGQPGMLSGETRRMIPGVQVVDRDFVLRYDGAGARAPHDLWTEVLPGVAVELEGGAKRRS
jgi:hypothetical protein